LGFGRYDFELYWLEVASDKEKIAFFDWSVGILKVGDQISFGEVTLKSLNGVSERQNVNFGKVGYVSGWSDLHHISQTHSEVLSDSFIHAYFSLIELVVDKCHNHSLFSLFALDEDRIAFEDFELCHLGLTELN